MLIWHVLYRDFKVGHGHSADFACFARLYTRKYKLGALSGPIPDMPFLLQHIIYTRSRALTDPL